MQKYLNPQKSKYNKSNKFTRVCNMNRKMSMKITLLIGFGRNGGKVSTLTFFLIG